MSKSIYVIEVYPLTVEQADLISTFVIENIGKECLHIKKGDLDHAIHKIIIN